MERDELLRLMADLESDRVERTTSTANTDKFAQAICAFANDLPQYQLPGVLFVGVDDKSGRPTGLEVTDRLLQNLAAIRSDGNVQPIPTISVAKHSMPGGDVAVVEVTPSDLPPVRYKGQVFVRVGPRRAIASEAEERILTERRVAQARTWDARPCSDATLEDLETDLFLAGYRQYAIDRAVLEENHRSLQDQLAALRFFDPKRGCPTNAALLLFGRDPLYFVPGAYVQYVRYGGQTLADEPLRERRYAGDLLSVMRSLDQLSEDLAEAHPIAGEGLSERTVYSYPPTALHELIINAVIHRNYEGSTTPVSIRQFDDRIEILSPGGLFGDLTREQFPHGTSYRNPILAEAAKTWGFVNRFGRGISIAQSELAKNNSPEARFEPATNYFLVILAERP